MTSRRRLLAAVAAGSATLSGCLGAPGDESAVLIDGIEVENGGSSTRDVAVGVREGDASVFETSVTVEPGAARALEPGIEGAGAYEVVASAGDEGVDGSVAGFAEGDDDCVRPVVRVTGRGDLGLTGRTFDDC